ASSRRPPELLDVPRTAPAPPVCRIGTETTPCPRSGSYSCARRAKTVPPSARRLDLERDAEPAADAQRREAARRAPLLHFMEERDQDARAGRADRVAERDRAAVHVQPVTRELELAVAREDLGREGLVQLDQVVVADLAAGAPAELADG